VIAATNLSKKYRKKLAVDDVSFNVETGKVTGFLGPNGAGKSTTMRLMLGLDYGKGTTLYDGKSLSEFKQPSKAVGILLEAKAYHPTRKAATHLNVLAAAGGISKKRVSEVLDIVGLNEMAKKRPGKFSLGMSQRLGIAAAILGHPKYLILDEPANGLDPEGIAWLRQFIKDYVADGKHAVFVSSHLLSEVAQMADNVVVIGRGKLIAQTSMQDLVAGSSHSGVLVRTSQQRKLEQLFSKQSIAFKKENGVFRATAQTTDQIGKLAFDAKIPILELAKQTASLEEAFFELTEDSQEYKAKLGKGKRS
jgi:ABC-2 type transport system ATP-binding protein